MTPCAHKRLMSSKAEDTNESMHAEQPSIQGKLSRGSVSAAKDLDPASLHNLQAARHWKAVNRTLSD